jgi:hypothetical protein
MSAIAVAAALIVASGCVTSDRGDGVYKFDPGTNPDVGDACPEGEPHLVIGLRPTVYDQDNRVVRRDQHLRACRGATIPRSHGLLYFVAGTSDGRDLLGFDGGEVLLIHGSSILWGIDHEDDYPVGSLFTMQFEGREVLGVLWMQYSSSWGEQLDLRELSDGALIRRFDVSSSVHLAGPAMDGSSDRVSASYDANGIQHYRVVAGADSLGTAGEWQVPRPHALTGLARELAVYPGMTLLAANEGVLYWNGDSPAFLGPVDCRWPINHGDTLPEPGEVQYLAAVPDRGRERTFLVLVDGRLLGASTSGSYIYRMTHRGECELLTESDGDHELSSIAWSGWQP